MSDALWALAQWLVAEPGRIIGVFAAVVCLGLFGGYWSGRRRR